MPVLNASIVGYKHYYTTTELINTEIVSPIDGYFGIGRNKTEAISEITILNKGLQAQINNIVNGTEYNAFFPKYLYDIDNETRQIIQRIRIESLVDSRVKLYINKSNSFLVHRYGRNKSDVEITSTDISLEDNFGISKSDSVNIVTTKSSAITGKLVKYLAIGDSWCAANHSKDLHGNTDTPWNYECSVIDNFIKTKIDLQDETSKIISIGFIGNVDDRTLTYNGQSYTLRSRNEGRGGWSAQSYLRHPVLVRQPGAGDISGKAAWDAIGLGRKELYGEAYDESVIYTEYTGSIEQVTEYLTTAMGYYHWDYSTELMNWLSIEGTYNGTEEQKTEIDGKMTSILTWKWNGNPFYDWDTAISSQGAYAFSLSKYLERYKTREEDGVTPLVKGETAGTCIEYDSQITDYAVCTPTHVTIELGINDYRGLTINQRASDIELLAQLIHAHDQNIKVGIVQLHVPGSFYPSIYSREGLFSLISDWTVDVYTKCLFELNKKISNDIVEYSGVNGIYYVPTYYIFGNLMAGASYQKDAAGNDLILDGTDSIHPSHNEHLEIGYQIYSWITYTLAQDV